MLDTQDVPPGIEQTLLAQSDPTSPVKFEGPGKAKKLHAAATSDVEG